MIFNRGNESGESTSVTKGALLDFFENVGEIRVQRMCAVGVSMAEVLDIFGKVTKEKDVVLTDFTSDFNLDMLTNPRSSRDRTYVCTITSSDDQTTIQNKLHVRSATCFSTSS
jgi:hypothetical protein